MAVDFWIVKLEQMRLAIRFGRFLSRLIGSSQLVPSMAKHQLDRDANFFDGRPLSLSFLGSGLSLLNLRICYRWLFRVECVLNGWFRVIRIPVIYSISWVCERRPVEGRGGFSLDYAIWKSLA